MNNQTGLTKENFFNEIAVSYSHANEVFKKFIDDYKASVDWDRLFNGGVQYGMGRVPAGPIVTKAPKFHELPFALQKGVLSTFFLLHDIQYNPCLHPFNPLKWTYFCHNNITKEMWTRFEDVDGKDLKEFDSADLAEIDAISLSFQTLEGRIYNKFKFQN